MNAPVPTTPEQRREIEGILAALRRAKRDAEDLAIATGTELVEADSQGRVILVTPAEIVARRQTAVETET